MIELEKSGFSDTGIRLLRKEQKGLKYAIFSRLGLTLLLLLLEIAVLFAGFHWFEGFLPGVYGAGTLFSVVMVVYLLNCSIDPSAKITWLVLILVFPIFGSLLFLYTKSDIGHRELKRRFHAIVTGSKQKLTQSAVVWNALQEEHPGAAALARYLQRSGNFPVYDRTAVTYFSSGEEKFEQLLTELRQAKEFIFLEYFIIDEGVMWGKVLEILIEKVKEGVEVRVLYDGTCEITTLPYDYPKRLKKLGITCKMFAPITPFVSTHYNYRDHRKIVVIDGHTAFTGGINLADEYINRVERFGHWKDTAIMLKGEGVKSFTLMFLQMWSVNDKTVDFDRYLAAETFPREEEGFVLPYGDCPLDRDKVGERVYMDLLNRAQHYVHIMTPYLILDGEMETALKFAAERGVEVILILPGIPDKKIPYALAKTHYSSLLESGVKIYEYTPGFVHAKVFVCDDKEAVVGTINLDYRSLYHHFECAAYLYDVPCIPQIEADFITTLDQCRPVVRETIRKEKLHTRLIGYLVKIFAPLL